MMRRCRAVAKLALLPAVKPPPAAPASPAPVTSAVTPALTAAAAASAAATPAAAAGAAAAATRAQQHRAARARTELWADIVLVGAVVVGCHVLWFGSWRASNGDMWRVH
jgi:hypothetical protein